MKYFISLKIAGYYVVYILENDYERKVMVEENNLDGFIQCLEYFGFQNSCF